MAGPAIVPRFHRRFSRDTFAELIEFGREFRGKRSVTDILDAKGRFDEPGLSLSVKAARRKVFESNGEWSTCNLLMRGYYIGGS